MTTPVHDGTMHTVGVYQDINYLVRRSSKLSSTMMSHLPARMAPVTEEKLPVGKIIEAARVRNRLTIAELAARVKIRPEILTRYETSQADPDVCAMFLLRNELGFDLG